ncbi:MAG TPA: GntG family PLP-dependent aldolase [Limnochordales bacterium]
MDKTVKPGAQPAGKAPAGAPVIDLRSDTVTQPTAAMLEAMASAPLGDDVLGHDPTVQRLEEAAAARLGKEAALFVPSGTMGNLIALLTHTVPGQEVWLEENCHIYYYEAGGVSRIAGLLPRLFRGERGIPQPDDIRGLYRPSGMHFPPPALLCLENTHNRGGGSVMPAERMRALVAVARELGLKVHLDGARVFNAAVALGVDVKELVGPADSVMVSLSKGLSAPAGSILAGSRDFIRQARRMRQMLGGGMRQAGVLAAAGLVALETMVDRLTEDHRVARELAAALAAIDGIRLDPVETNIVLFTLPMGYEAGAFLERLAARGVLGVPFGPRQVRFVTHRHVTQEAVPQVAAAVRACL